MYALYSTLVYYSTHVAVGSHTSTSLSFWSGHKQHHRII